MLVCGVTVNCKKVSPFIQDCRYGIDLRLSIFAEEQNSVLNVELVCLSD